MKTTVQLLLLLFGISLFFSCSDGTQLLLSSENDKIEATLNFDINKINEDSKNDNNIFDHFGKEHNLMSSNILTRSENENLFEKAIESYQLSDLKRLEITETITMENYNNDFRNSPLLNKVNSNILKTEMISFLKYFREVNVEGGFSTLEDVNAAILLYESNATTKFENSFDLQTYLEFTSTFRHSANYWFNYEISTPTTRAWKWWKFVIVAAADAIGATGGVATAISASAASITLVDKAL